MSEKWHRISTDIFGLWADLGQRSATQFLYLLLPSTFSSIKSLNSGHMHTICSIPNSHCFSEHFSVFTGTEPSNCSFCQWPPGNEVILPLLEREVTLPKLFYLLLFVTTFRMRQHPPSPASSPNHQVWASTCEHQLVSIWRYTQRKRDIHTHTHNDGFSKNWEKQLRSAGNIFTR